MRTVTGTVNLQAVVQEKKGWYPDIYVCDQIVVPGNPENWAHITNVEFRASGYLVGSTGVGTENADLVLDPSGHTYRASVSWNSATMVSCSVPKWADGDHELEVSAYCGESVSQATANVNVKNKGGIYGVVKDAVSGEPISGADIEITCTDQPGETPKQVATTSSGGDGAYSVDLYPGHYGIKVTETCHVTSNSGITIGPAQLANLDIPMQPCLTITATPGTIPADGQSTSFIEVRLVDQSGAPVVNAPIMLESSSGSFEPPPQEVRQVTLVSDSDGYGYLDANNNSVFDEGEQKGASFRASDCEYDSSSVLTANAGGCSVDARVWWQMMCGPDITAHLNDALQQIDNMFFSWSSTDRTSACEGLVSLATASSAWDIEDLHQWGPGASGCGSSCGRGSCDGTVSVSGGCFWPQNVNYTAYGRMCKLCYDWMSIPPTDPLYPPENWLESEMLYRINLWKNGVYNSSYTDEAMAWASIGYNYGNLSSVPSSDIPCPSCGEVHDGDPFIVKWKRLTIP